MKVAGSQETNGLGFWTKTQDRPPDCTEAEWYQGNAKLIACKDERSAARYKAIITKVGEVYPGEIKHKISAIE